MICLDALHARAMGSGIGAVDRFGERLGREVDCLKRESCRTRHLAFAREAIGGRQ